MDSNWYFDQRCKEVQKSASSEINTSHPRHGGKALLKGPQVSSSPPIPAPTMRMATLAPMLGTETAELMTGISSQWAAQADGARVDHANRELARSTWKPQSKQIIFHVLKYA